MASYPGPADLMDVSPSAMELEEVGRVRARLRFRMLSIPCGLTGLVEVPEGGEWSVPSGEEVVVEDGGCVGGRGWWWWMWWMWLT